MDKRPFKKHSIKEQDSVFREKYNILDEKYTKIKEILKQVLADVRELKLEKQRLRDEQEKLVAEIREKDALLERMQSVSEAVIDEYTALKLKCDLETEAANNAIKRATKYFQENQKLKGNSGPESESDIAEDTNDIHSQESSSDENTSELDVLNNLSSELRTEIANLKIQLSKEIEKQNSLKEDFEIAKNLYEQEMKDHNCTKERLQSLQLIYSNSSLEAIDSENYHPYNSFQTNQDDTNTRECFSKKHDENLDNLTTKLESVEVEVENYKQENGKLLCKIQELESQIRKLNKEVSASDLLPIPPPPPPPPLPPPSFNPIKSLITFIHAGKKSAKTVKKENTENPQQKAMSEMIDAIKKGNIQLKPTPKTVLLSPRKEVEETALGEMKNILASLKKKNSPCEDAKSSEKTNVHEKSSVDISNPEADENFNVGSDIDDELKSLLRKQSIKITTNKVSDDELNDDSLPVVIDDDKEIEKDCEIALQEAATLDEIPGFSNDFTDNSRLCSENEKKIEISSQELVIANENQFVDNVLSDKSIMSTENEKSPEILLQESATPDKNKLADNFPSNNRKINMENDRNIEMPLKKSETENHLIDGVSLDSKMSYENKSHEISLLKSAAESQVADIVFPFNSGISTENEKSLEIPFQELITGNMLPDHPFTNNRKNTENEKCHGSPLQESANENLLAENVFSDNNENTENDKSPKILMLEATAENHSAVDFFPDSKKSVENEKRGGIPLQESVDEIQFADNVFFANIEKNAENNKSPQISLPESTNENQPAAHVLSDDCRKSAGNEERLRISLKESTTSGEMQFVDSFHSDNSGKSSENETIII